MTAGDIKVRIGDHGASSAMSGIVCNGVDDYVQIDAVATLEAAQGYTKGTISAWVCIPNVTATFAVFSIGLSSAVSHYGLRIKAGKPQFYATTANTVKADYSATTASLIPHKWHHVCVTQSGAIPTLYLDGVAVAMTITDGTTPGYWGDTLATWDKGAIGINVTNGTTINDFLGGISYVKYSSSAAVTSCWTPAQVKAEYDYRGGLGSGSGTASDLCTWTLNGTLADSQTGGATYDGTIVSDVQYDAEYSQLTSKIRLLAPVVADDFTMVSRGGDGYIFMVVKAA